MVPSVLKSRIFKASVGCLVTLVLVVACASLRVAAQSETPDAATLREQVMACIPDSPPGIVEAVEVAGLAEVDGTHYVYFYAYDTRVPENPENPDDPTAANYEAYPSDLVISLTDGVCAMGHFNPMGDPIPLAQTLDQVVARQLTLDRYQRTIEQIGRDGLQARINSWAEDPGVQGAYLWDEEQWALEQLGMAIPASLLDPALNP
ncbi:MAG: hypothetical protein AAF773_00960 [Cyanobacteria bacterium P01_D01_bin.115]